MAAVKYIYMSEEIKKPSPNASRVMVVQEGKKLKYASGLEIVVDGRTVARVRFSSLGLPDAPDHFVRAWIETDCEVVG